MEKIAPCRKYFRFLHESHKGNLSITSAITLVKFPVSSTTIGRSGLFVYALHSSAGLHCRWELIYLMVDRMVNSTVLVLLRYPKYLGSRMILPMKYCFLFVWVEFYVPSVRLAVPAIAVWQSIYRISRAIYIKMIDEGIILSMDNFNQCDKVQSGPY